MPNNLDVGKLIGDVSALNKQIANTSTLLSELITKQTTLNKELGSAKGLKSAQDALNKSKVNSNQIEIEAAKLTNAKNRAIVQQDKALRTLTLDTIKQKEALKEQNKQLRDQARSDLGLSKRSNLFQTLTKSILASAGAMFSINAALKVGKELLRVFFAGTQNSADRLRIKLAGLKAQFDTLKDSIANLGDTGGDALDNVETKTGKVFKALLLFAKTKLLGLDKALELEVVGAAAEALGVRLIALERAEANLELTNAKRRRDIKEFQLLAEDENQSYDVRIKALQDGAAIEKKVDEDRQAAMRERIAIALTDKTITDEQIAQIVEQGLKLEDVGLTLTTEKERVEVTKQITKYYDDQSESLLKQKKLLGQTNTLRDEQLAAEKAIRAEREKETSINTFGGSGGVEVQITQTMKDQLNARYEANAEYLKRIESDEKMSAERRKQIQQDTMAFSQDLGNVLFDIGQARRDSELSDIESKYALKIKDAEGNAELQKKLEEELAVEQRRIRHEQAVADRNRALFNIAINTAMGVSLAWGQTGIFGVAAEIPVLVMGALQTAAVLASPLPGFFRGTENAPEGLGWVAEKGFELIQSKGKFEIADEPQIRDFKGGEKVFTHEKSMDMINAAIYKDISINGNEGMESRLDSLIDAFKNQPREVTTFDDDGIKRHLSKGLSITHYLNKRGRK